MSTPPLSNAEIAERFELLADLLELDGAEIYRTLAYRRAAKTLRETPESVVRMSEQGRLTDLPNVGRTIADKVAEMRETGTLQALEKLVARTPPGVVPLMRIPGIGPKTARKIFADLEITTLQEAVVAAEQGRIRGLAGMGEKTEQAILAGAMVAEGEKRPRVSSAKLRPFAERVVGMLRRVEGVERCEIAGSLRRYTDTAKDIDLVVSATDPEAVAEAFVTGDWVAAVESKGTTKSAAVAYDGTRVELRIVEPGVFGNLLQHLSGSKDHNVAIREQAVRAGLKVSEYGIEVVETGELFETDDEVEVYRRLGMDWVPPELRENRGEIEAARNGALPELVEASQIRGDLHSHTDWSDGKTTLEAMVAAARDRGYGYLNITDHSPAVGFGMGLDAGRLRQQIDRVRELAGTCAPGFVLLAGCEVDILGHPTGRLISRREGYAVDMEAVIDTAVETGTVLEVSAQPDRLDLRDTHVRLAVKAAARLAIDTDAHSVAALDYSRFGVMNARRGWATPADVINTREWPQVKELLKDGRAGVAGRRS